MTIGKNLFELSHNVQALEERLDACETDDQAILLIAEELEANRGRMGDKIDQYCGLIGDLNALATIRKAEVERVKALQVLATAKAERLTECLKTALKTIGVKSFSTGRHVVTVSGNGGLIPIKIKGGEVPPSYMRKVETEVIDSEKIRKELAAGVKLPFAEFMPKGDHLRIK